MEAEDQKKSYALGRIGVHGTQDEKSGDAQAEATPDQVQAGGHPAEALNQGDLSETAHGTDDAGPVGLEAAQAPDEPEGTAEEEIEGDVTSHEGDAAASEVDTETPLILAVQQILSLSGMAFSPGAVRDLPELTSEQFDPKSAVSALRHVGFEASYGEMWVKKLRASHLPAIGFLTSGEAVVVQAITEDGQILVKRFTADEPFVEETWPRKELEQGLKPYFVLARPVHKRPSRKARMTGSGDRWRRARGFMGRF